MNNSTLTFYDFVAEIIPGSIFLVGSSILFDVGIMSSILIPNEFGSLGIHLILAYVAGQLLQAVGNWFEKIYWSLWKGMPTDWPITKRNKSNHDLLIDTVFSLNNDVHTKYEQKKLLPQWRTNLNSIRSNILTNNSQGRIQVFNSLYGMFRGLFTSFLLLLVIFIIVYKNFSYTAILLFILSGLSLFRFHRYANYYASELFSTIRWIKNNQKTKEREK